MSAPAPPHIAIIGGGIAGLILALSLTHRHIPVAVYERAPTFRYIGAGIASSSCMRACLAILDPDVADFVERVSGPPMTPFLTLLDGVHDTGDEERVWLRTGDGHVGAFRPVHRAVLMEALWARMPVGMVRLGKRLETYGEGEGGRVELVFTDGSRAEADAVVGCDGVRSRTRQVMFGSDNPVSFASYTHKFVYRAVVPMDKMVAAVGEVKAKTPAHRTGRGGHMVQYPVADGQLVNLVMYRVDESAWPDPERLTLPGERAEVLEFYKDWSPLVKGILGAMGEDLDRWAIFDMAEHPAPYFNKGRVCLVGDAAHAASPHHGSGASFGVEDVLALVTALEEVQKDAEASGTRSQAKLNEQLTAAFAAYNAVRYERGIWLVQSSREAGDLYEWLGPDGDDAEKVTKDILNRHRTLYGLDVPAMVQQTREEYWKRVSC